MEKISEKVFQMALEPFLNQILWKLAKIAKLDLNLLGVRGGGMPINLKYGLSYASIKNEYGHI
jgi:hypothetical protein